MCQDFICHPVQLASLGKQLSRCVSASVRVQATQLLLSYLPKFLTHSGLVTPYSVKNLINTDSAGLAPNHYLNPCWLILSTRHLRPNFCEIYIKIWNFFQVVNISKWQPFRSGLNVLSQGLVLQLAVLSLDVTGATAVAPLLTWINFNPSMDK